MLKTMFSFIGEMVFDGLVSNIDGRDVDCSEGKILDIHIYPTDKYGFTDYVINYENRKDQRFTKIQEVQVTNTRWTFIHKDGSKSYIRKQV